MRKKTKLWLLLLIIPVLLVLGRSLAIRIPTPDQTRQSTSQPSLFQTSAPTWEPIHYIELGRNFGQWIIKSNDNYVYIIFNKQFRVLDNTHYQEIKVASVYYGDYIFADFAVEHELVFLTSVRRGLIVIELSDPSFPTQISVYPSEGSRKYSDILIENNIAFVNDYTDIDPEDLRKGVLTQILDISDPSNIKFVASIQDAGHPFAVFGDYLYTSGRHTEDDYLHSWLNIYNIADINNPELVFYTNDFGSVYFAARRGSYLFISSSNDFVIVDISDPILPIEVSTLNLGVEGITLDGDYLYYTNIYGVGVVDISNLERPKLIASNNDLLKYSTGISMCQGYVCAGSSSPGDLYIFETWGK